MLGAFHGEATVRSGMYGQGAPCPSRRVELVTVAVPLSIILRWIRGLLVSPNTPELDGLNAALASAVATAVPVGLARDWTGARSCNEMTSRKRFNCLPFTQLPEACVQ